MSSINANIADYFKQIESLTKTNLQILKTLNDSFFTKKNHIYTEIDDTTYVIPSFISLENKINMLQENFENLVKSPETGEAHFNFDGNTRAIEIRKYNHTPDSIKLSNVSNFSTEANNIFKDFLTPVPYVNIDLPKASIPDDIHKVNVKKIVVKSDELKTHFKDALLDNQSVNATYASIHKLLYNFINGVHYEEYDTVYSLPTHKNVGTGSYIIESVISDVINEDLEELITLKINGKLTYKLFDETLEKPLQVGDELVNFDASGKVVITNIVPSTNTITVKVVNGEYLNFLGTDSYDTDNDNDIHDLSKLRFFGAVDYDDNKYVKVPLEEDQYIFIAVAPINERLNIQSAWGTGLIIDTHSLTTAVDGKSTTFQEYYDKNVQNIGDILFEITDVITSPITSLSNDDFNKLAKFKPILNSDDLQVMQINKHLNDSATVKNIRNAYSQKKAAEAQLTQIQTKINDINKQIASTLFNDTEGIRQAYMTELSELTNQKNDLILSITNAINEITVNVNAAEVPIENAKYRIRGFYTPSSLPNDVDINSHVIGIQVQYRYKNISSETGNAVSLNNKDGKDSYIYSDWNLLHTVNRNRIAEPSGVGYDYKYEATNETKNEPSYNQIDIPISQGETVDIRLKLIYDFGQPFITVSSDWSETINIAFPDEFVQDVTITSILEEISSDANQNKLRNIIDNTGINTHIADSAIDQNITYYHKSESIASGFYTEERKIIPLKDKLLTMVNDIAELKSEVLGSKNSKYEIKLTLGDSSKQLLPDAENIFTVEPYNTFSQIEGYFTNGIYTVENGVVYTKLNLSIKNTGDTVLKLYSIFPGNRSTLINNVKSTIADIANYCVGSDGGVFYKYRTTANTGTDPNKPIYIDKSLQRLNQFITFRTKDLWDGTEYYISGTGKVQNIIKTNNKIYSNDVQSVGNEGMVICPLVQSKYAMCIDSDETRAYKTVNPGEEIIIPIYCEYRFYEGGNSITSICKTMTFDLRTNLYSNEFANYTFTILATNKKPDAAEQMMQDSSQSNVSGTGKYNSTVS